MIEDFQQNIIVLSKGLKFHLLLMDICVVLLTVFNQFLAHLNVQIIEAVNTSSELRVVVSLCKHCSSIDWVQDLQNKVNDLKRWNNELQVFILIRDFLHSLKQSGKNVDECLIGFALDKEILVNLSQVINGKLNKVYWFNLSLESHWGIVIQLLQFSSQPATQILQNGPEAISDTLQEGPEPANE